MEKVKIKKREREILPAGLSQYHEYAYILWKSRTQMPGISEKQRKFWSRREKKRREEKRRECMGFSDINLSNWDLYTFQ